MLQFTKLFLCASALIGTLFLSHQTGLYTPFGCNLAKEAAGFGLDNDPYSDVGIDPPIEVVVPSCPQIKFMPLAFDRAVSNAWYDLQDPLDLSGNYSVRGFDPSGGTGRYGREHIYEVQLLVLFIDSIRTDPNSQQIWSYSNNFCGWVNFYLNQPYADPRRKPPSLSLIDRLRQCLPNNSNPVPNNGPFMPWLEQTANGIKALAWSGKMIRKPETFNNYSPDKKVSVMRATAGVKSYMSSPFVTYSWDQQTACVRTEWDKWLAIYKTDPSVPQSAQNVDIVKSYNLWIDERIQQFKNGLTVGMQNMVLWWNQAYGETNSVNVHLNFPYMLNQSPLTAVTGQGLEAMWFTAGGFFAPLLNSTLVIQ